MKHGDIIEVVWGDAWTSAKQTYHKGGDYTTCAMTTVGYFMEENDETIVLCVQRVDDDGIRYANIHCIPLTWVIEVYEWVG